MSWFTKAWFGCVALCAASAAQAAPPPPMFTWSGFYIGGHAGGAWSTTTVGDYDGLLFPPFVLPGPLIIPGLISTLGGASGRDGSFIGGAQAGYNWQMNNWVVGIEADASGADLKATASQSATRFPGTTASQTVTIDTATKINWMASLRGRLGYSFDSVLLYATGGLALGGIDGNGTATVANGTAVIIPVGTFTSTTSNSRTKAGWTLGAGFEWAINAAWRVGAEYRHTHFGNVGVNADIPDGLGTTFATVSNNVSVKIDQVTVRVVRRFAP